MKNFIKKMLKNELVEDVVIGTIICVCGYGIIYMTAIMN